ncbi:response regulator transcription factor [Salipiger sp. 1_MG-2023]|uniref:response regulator transcription factor n=1 Tax=Salipiger sp. 1_MG-2023 TaxID=3062665 RepID=UPI0026E2A2ED|nr:response regulator transcription factor [Salipiger sp. 1_MG-2023]MDO6587800.1 response regulator transcription factor [Salipiger sp. 1_MG-2023]
MSLRVLFADDHDMVRDTFRMYLETNGTAQAVTAGSLDEALKLMEQKGPFDLVLLDYTMPGMKGLEGLKRALAASGGHPVGIISGTGTRLIAQQALDLGAAGFLPKSLPAKTLVNAVKFMAMGEIYAPVDFMSGKDDPDETDFEKDLSDREKQVLRGLLGAKSNKEIAIGLDLQEVTIKLHVKTLCRKIGARNRTEAAILARDAGFV